MLFWGGFLYLRDEARLIMFSGSGGLACPAPFAMTWFPSPISTKSTPMLALFWLSARMLLRSFGCFLFEEYACVCEIEFDARYCSVWSLLEP